MPFLDRAGVRIWYDTIGTGDPLLLVPGLGDPADAAWRVLPALAGRHTVVLVDNRGAGRSDPAGQSFTIADLARDAAGVLDRIGLGPAHVAGFSMGGLIAQELALGEPEIVRSLILGCTSPGGRDAVPMSAAAAPALVPGRRYSRADRLWGEARVCYAPSTSRAAIEEDIEAKLRRPVNRLGYAAQLGAVGRYRGAGRRLRDWTGPTLIVHGTADQVVPVANAERLAALVPHAQLRLIEGAGHILMTDATDELVAAMVEFTGRCDESEVREAEAGSW